jgi:6-dehydroglucose reductase
VPATDEILKIDRTRSLGPFRVGRLAYGCWRFAGSSRPEAQAKIGAALDIGANLIDTAAIYGHRISFGAAEALLGDVLASDKGLRAKIVLVSKAGIVPPMPYDSRKASLIASCEASLARLRTDRLDVLLIHRPDLLASPEDVAEALSTLRAAGKIREAGVSNYSPAQIRALQSALDFPLVVTQPEFSALHPQALFDGSLDLAQEMRLAPMAWSPLAGGALASGQGGSDPDRLSRIISALDRLAAAKGCDRTALALAWVLAHPSWPVAIIGTQNPARIRACGAAYDVHMTRTEWYAILQASLGERLP